MPDFLRVETTFAGGPNRVQQLMNFLTKEYPKNVNKAAAAAFEELGEALVEDIQESISQLYPPASRPGSPPHQRTGELLNSYEFDVKGKGFFSGKQPTLNFFSTSGYSGYLEFGTRKMAPRPHVRPALSRQFPKYADYFAAALEKYSTRGIR